MKDAFIRSGYEDERHCYVNSFKSLVSMLWILRIQYMSFIEETFERATMKRIIILHTTSSPVTLIHIRSQLIIIKAHMDKRIARAFLSHCTVFTCLWVWDSLSLHTLVLMRLTELISKGAWHEWKISKRAKKHDLMTDSVYYLTILKK